MPVGFLESVPFLLNLIHSSMGIRIALYYDAGQNPINKN